MCIVYGSCTYDCGEINDSAKWPRENEWMTDPIAIGDIDGPEVQTALSLGSLTKRNLFVFALNLCLSFFSTGSGLCGGWCTSG